MSEEIIPAPRLRERVAVCAHRGACGLAPENTIPALEKAIELGCEAVEIDVRTTADGEIVVMHNSTVDATTNGTGPVAEFTLAEIRGLDAGAHFGPQFAGTRVPTLAEALECCKGRTLVVLEVKQATVDAILRIVNDCRAREEVAVLTGVEWLAELRARDAGISVVAQPWHVDEVVPALERLKPEYSIVRWKPGRETNTFYPHIIEACHRYGTQICQNVLGQKDTPEGVRAVITAGVDIIETDEPEMVMAVAGEMGAR